MTLRKIRAFNLRCVPSFTLAAMATVLLAACVPPTGAITEPPPSPLPEATVSATAGATESATTAAATTTSEPTNTLSPTATTRARPLPRVQNTAVFGASAGLVWNFIALEEGVMQFQVEADENAFTEQAAPVTNDGAGIERVVFVVSAPNGDSLTIEDAATPYCLPRGETVCEGFAVENDLDVWPDGAPVQGGDHTVAITIFLSDGQTRDLFGNFTLELP